MNLALQNSDQLRAVLAHLNITAHADKAEMINQVLSALEYGQITKQEIKKICETAVPSPRGVDGEVRQQILDSNTKVHAALQDVVNAQSSINRVRDAVEAKLADIDGAFKRLDDRLTSKVAGLAAPMGLASAQRSRRVWPDSSMSFAERFRSSGWRRSHPLFPCSA
jgi:uncharacterized membrane protein YccC